VSIEFPRFRDITEYSTNAIIIPRKSYSHPTLREPTLVVPFTAYQQYLLAKILKTLERKTFWGKK